MTQRDGPLFSLDNTQREWRTTRSASNHPTDKNSKVLSASYK